MTRRVMYDKEGSVVRSTCQIMSACILLHVLCTRNTHTTHGLHTKNIHTAHYIHPSHPSYLKNGESLLSLTTGSFPTASTTSCPSTTTPIGRLVASSSGAGALVMAKEVPLGASPNTSCTLMSLPWYAMSFSFTSLCVCGCGWVDADVFFLL